MITLSGIARRGAKCIHIAVVFSSWEGVCPSEPNSGFSIVEASEDKLIRKEIAKKWYRSRIDE
jgi:hypothetical protein